jgi:hypothetical protein
MNTVRTVLAFIFLAIVLGTTGCACNKQYRTSYGPFNAAKPDHKAIIESTEFYKLGFVEFDDQGQFWDLNQRDVVEQMVRDQAGISDKTHSASQPMVLVLFVHGWKDNAEYDNYGVQAFRDILEKLNSLEHTAETKNLRTARKVVGVYAGWRGLSAAWEPFKELSFWDRKETAHKVGGYGAMTKLLVDLETIQKQSLEQRAKGAPRTELIIIGHSLGAAALYSALSQIITERFINTIGNTTKQATIKPLGDQIILLNPAFEAQRHYDLNQLVTSIHSFPNNQRPVLSVFTSQTDLATKYVFPISQFFSTLFQSDRDDQYEAGLQTIGWYKPFLTHDLKYLDDKSTSNDGDKSQSFDIVQAARALWEQKGQTAQTYHLPHATLKPYSTYKAGNPFWIVSVDPYFMDGHNDIYNSQLITFLRDFIEFSRVDPREPSK